MATQSPEQNTFADPMCKITRYENRDEWRTNLYDDVGDQLGENTRSGAVDGACEFTREMPGNLERAVKHPDMTEELAEILSTRACRR